MPSGAAQRALAVVQAPLPDLWVGSNHTTTSDLHDNRFIGTLRFWPSFKFTVQSFCAGINWDQYTQALIYKTSKHWDLNHREQTEVGDKKALQAVFQKRLGDPVTAICRVTDRDAQVTDFKATSAVQINRLVPDLAIAKAGNSLAAVGEVNVPWVEEHELGLAMGETDHLRNVLGHIALCMKTYKVKYGFHTTYEETIFLKQERTSSGWVLYYSSPIRHDAIGDRSNGTVSIRECFLYLVDEAINSPVADNDQQRWVS